MNIAFLNGQFVPAETAKVSIFDRGFLYGDGVFETVRVQGGKPFRWPAHSARLVRGLAALGIVLPWPSAQLSGLAAELIDANHCSDGVLRVTISRGTGSRGYSPAGAVTPTVVMTMHSRPAAARAGGLHLISSSVRVWAGDALSSIKTANKLRHVLARAEADAAGADDAMLFNERGELTETSGSNVFWLKGDVLSTASPGAGILPGLARGIVVDLAPSLGLRGQETFSKAEELFQAEGVFVTNMVTGPLAVATMDGKDLARSDRVEKITAAFEALVQRET